MYDLHGFFSSLVICILSSLSNVYVSVRRFINFSAGYRYIQLVAMNILGSSCRVYIEHLVDQGHFIFLILMNKYIYIYQARQMFIIKPFLLMTISKTFSFPITPAHIVLCAGVYFK